MDRARRVRFTNVIRPAGVADAHSARNRGRAVRLAMACLITLASTALSEGGRGIAVAEEKVELRGAGATFPAPLYQKWIQSFDGSSQRLRLRMTWWVAARGSDGSLAAT